MGDFVVGESRAAGSRGARVAARAERTLVARVTEAQHTGGSLSEGDDTEAESSVVKRQSVPSWSKRRRKFFFARQSRPRVDCCERKKEKTATDNVPKGGMGGRHAATHTAIFKYLGDELKMTS